MKELVYPRLLLPRVERLADKVAFIDLTREGVRYQGTLGDHLSRVLRLASAMRTELGLKPGDRFAVLAMNGHEFIELYHAAMFGAGIINPLNIRFTAPELAYVLNNSGCKVVFTDPVFATLVERARGEGAKVDKVVVIGGDGDADGAPSEHPTIGYESLLASGELVMHLRDARADESETLVLKANSDLLVIPAYVYHAGGNVSDQPCLSVMFASSPPRDAKDEYFL